VALEGAELRLPDGHILQGTKLENLCRSFLTVQQHVARLSRRYDARVLEKLIYLDTLTPAMLQEHARCEAFVRELQERLTDDRNGGRRYDVSLGVDSRNNLCEILVARSEHGAVTHSRFDADFVQSGEYAAMRALGARLAELFTGEVTALRGEKSLAADRFEAVLEWLMGEARRGQTIQRYKGLGEMNPEQLWETTMDPGTRRLLKVTADDDVIASEVFTTLMGNQVEPRREFIEKNALSVSNLDI